MASGSFGCVSWSVAALRKLFGLGMQMLCAGILLPPALGSGGPGRRPRERFSFRDSSINSPDMIRNPIQAKAEMNTSMNIGPPSAWVTTAAAHKPAVSTVVVALMTRMCAGGRARARAGLRGGWAPASPAGMSAVTSASSAQVREVSARATRASSSSLVSRPCTNPALSTSITCSRSAWDARRATAVLPGCLARLPVLTSLAPPRQYGACKPSAAAFLAAIPAGATSGEGPATARPPSRPGRAYPQTAAAS